MLLVIYVERSLCLVRIFLAKVGPILIKYSLKFEAVTFLSVTLLMLIQNLSEIELFLLLLKTTFINDHTFLKLLLF